MCVCIYLYIWKKMMKRNLMVWRKFEKQNNQKVKN